MDEKDKKVLEDTLKRYGLPALTRIENGGRIATGWYSNTLNVYAKGRQWVGHYTDYISEIYGQLKSLQINLDKGTINSAFLERDGGRTVILKSVNSLEIKLEKQDSGFEERLTPSALGISKLQENSFQVSGESTGFLVPVK